MQIEYKIGEPLIVEGIYKLTATDAIASGDVLTTSSGKQYTLIVAGDLTKDGQVYIQDFVRMRRYIEPISGNIK